MKKFLIFLSLLFLLGCSLYKKITIYEKSFSYEERAEAIEQAYWWVEAYKGDSIPMDEWFVFQNYIDDGYMIEKVYQKRFDEKTEFVVILTTCICDSTSYHLSVLHRTKDKRLWKF